MTLEAGAIVEGRVTGIAPYGAFIALPEKKTGLVHISEISYSYINSVRDVLTEGQTVTVKILNVEDSGRYSLSIKKALPPPSAPARQHPPREGNAAPRPAASGPRPSHNRDNRDNRDFRKPAPPTADVSFEDKLKQFMQASDSKLSDSGLFKKSTNRRNGNRR